MHLPGRSIGTILGAIYSESLIALLPAGPWYNHAMFVIMVVLAVFVTSYAQGLPALKSKAYAITLFKACAGADAPSTAAIATLRRGLIE
jgi:hypothetical protein